MKMYILIRDNVLPGNAIVAAAHGSLMCHLKFNERGTYKEWLQSSFKKVVCKVNDEEFEYAKSIAEDCGLVITESRLNNAEVGIVFCPGTERNYE